MTELDPGAKELIALAANGDGPTDAERARLRAAVLAQLGSGALGVKAGSAAASVALRAAAAGAAGAGAAGAVVSSAAGAGGVAAGTAVGGSVAVFAAKMVAIGAVLTGVGAGGYVAVSHRAAPTAAVAAKGTQEAPEKLVPIGATASRRRAGGPGGASGTASAGGAEAADPPTAAGSASAAPEPEPTASLVAEPVPAAPQAAPAPEAPPVPTIATHPRPAWTARSAPVSESVPETLEEETKALGQALSALRASHPDTALALLDAQDVRYPRGALAEERAAARIEAMCALGRAGEATSLASRFLAQHPRSLQAARVRASCAGPKATGSAAP